MCFVKEAKEEKDRIWIGIVLQMEGVEWLKVGLPHSVWIYNGKELQWTNVRESEWIWKRGDVLDVMAAERIVPWKLFCQVWSLYGGDEYK